MKDILGFFALIKAVLKRQYPMPWKTFFLTILCVVYFVSPIDIIPDILPALGIADDATFILLVLACIRQEVAKYRNSLQAKPPQDNVIDVGDIKEHKK